MKAKKRKRAGTKRKQANATGTRSRAAVAAVPILATVVTEGTDDLSAADSLTADQELDGEDKVEGNEAYQWQEPETMSIAGTDSNSEDDDDEPALKKAKNISKITAYIDIITPSRSAKAKETAITWGPFFFTIETTHREFLSLVATAAAEKNTTAGIGSVNQSQLLWKLNVPANDKKKPLSNEQGYEALIVMLTNSESAFFREVKGQLYHHYHAPSTKKCISAHSLLCLFLFSESSHVIVQRQKGCKTLTRKNLHVDLFQLSVNKR